jgi:parvulin-like peptidyl-prolyl isomerase
MTAFVVVNGREITVEQALRHARLGGDAGRLLDTLIEGELLRQHAAARGIAVRDEELQRAADEMRYERGLRSGARTHEWLRAHGQTLGSMQAELELLLLRNKVMAAIPAHEVESRYAAEAAEYVALFSIRLASEPEAAAVRARLEAGALFPAVAAAASLDRATGENGGFVGRLRRAELAPEIAEIVFAATPGTLLGPVPTELGVNLLLVADRRTPTLEEEAAGIRLLIFDELVARLREAADVRYPALDL